MRSNNKIPEEFKKRFIQFAEDAGVLKFGTFTLKSGRISPYFFNAGLFYQGQTLKILGQFYAQLFVYHKLQATHLFGPAYKGLPLATATSIALADKGIDICVSFNRKEAKNHGEQGLIIGAPLNQSQICIIDDVITAGTAFYEAKELINTQNGQIKSVMIALNRCEKSNKAHSTLTEIKQQGIEVVSIIDFHDLTKYLKEQHQTAKLKALYDYYEQYGID
ncbi:MAG: orotate phosphoribosyltransferase [Legionellaceae bacterium]|nr:orotate phosphoribosyltransferase [Legionellaceae bacterium]HCA90080.1 orotate phosphoribosyltransferase [Legionellales bacterium]|tara:strand:+ start:870 stop:1529 length:660 start_codon:yes stop_codon:yes gene_type:complete